MSMGAYRHTLQRSGIAGRIDRSPYDPEMDSTRPTRGVGAAIRRHWALILVPVVVAAGAAFVTQVARDRIDDAVVPVAVAAGCGLVIGLVAAWIAQRRGAGLVRRAGDLTRVAGVPNLAVVPRPPFDVALDDVSVALDPQSTSAIAYRPLRASIAHIAATESRSDERRGTVVLVTGPTAADGASSAAVDLAATAAAAGERVVLVDANLVAPVVHRRFGVRNEVGLASVLTATATLAEAVQRVSGAEVFAVLPAGPFVREPGALLGNGRLAPTLDGLARAADLVVVDGPAVLSGVELSAVARSADVVLLGATGWLSERKDCAHASARLSAARVGLDGTVLLEVDDGSTPPARDGSAAADDWWVYRPGSEGSSVDDPTAEVPRPPTG
jgi:Mrp family chromosome partitioning ATPase